jgi:hypothetical protein
MGLLGLANGGWPACGNSAPPGGSIGSCPCSSAFSCFEPGKVIAFAISAARLGGSV